MPNSREVLYLVELAVRSSSGTSEAFHLLEKHTSLGRRELLHLTIATQLAVHRRSCIDAIPDHLGFLACDSTSDGVGNDARLGVIELK